VRYERQRLKIPTSVTYPESGTVELSRVDRDNLHLMATCHVCKISLLLRLRDSLENTQLSMSASAEIEGESAFVGKHFDTRNDSGIGRLALGW